MARLQAGASFSALAAELGLRRKLLHDWHKAYSRAGVEGFNRKRGPKPVGEGTKPPSQRKVQGDPLAQAQLRIAELERLVGQQQVDLDFFRKALRLIGADSLNSTAPGSTRSSQP